MPKKYTDEEFWKLYKQLPKELQEAISSDENVTALSNICEKYNILEYAFDISEYTAQVLLGVLPPDEFEEILQQELGFEKETAKKVTQEIYRFIFYPVKSRLEELYKIQIAPFAKMPVTPPPSEKLPEPPKKEDVYREAIE